MFSWLTRPWAMGVKEVMPLLGGYVALSMSFGLVAHQAGYSVAATVAISTLMYAGAAQFVFITLASAGAPIWLVVSMALFVNVRHVVYGPNIAPWMNKSRWWPWLMHGLTDQIFAMAHTRFPQMSAHERLPWFAGAMLLAWFSWIVGTLIGAVAGNEMIAHWPLLNDVMPAALPALLLVLLGARLSTLKSATIMLLTMMAALALTLWGYKNAAIPAATIFGVLVHLALKKTEQRGKANG